MLFFFEHHGMEAKDLFHANRLQNLSFPAHLHRAYELIYINSGTLTLQVEQNRYYLEKKDLAFIFCNQIHSFSGSEKSDIIVVLFSPEIIGDFYSTYKDTAPISNVLRLKKDYDFLNLKSIYAQKSMLYYICDALLSTTSLKPIDSKSQAAILQQIFAYIDKNFGNDCSLKTVAKSMQYDYAYLSKLFTRLTGLRFTEYLNNYRISQACYLLKTERWSVSEIASYCGYENLRTFHRNFRLIIGCSPKEYPFQI